MRRHNSRSPASYSETEWEVVMMHMRMRAQSRSGRTQEDPRISQVRKLSCASAFAKTADLLQRFIGKRVRAIAGSICTIARVFLAVSLLSWGCSLLNASHPTTAEKGPPTGPKGATVVGSLGEVERGPRGKSEIALTFDAGAEAECFEDLITALESAHVNSTFFITGRFTQEHSDCAAEITKRGHEIGNHTWSHLNLTQQPDDVVRDEITRAERAIVQVSGQNPKPRWRAPYGARDNRVLKIATNLGYRSIYWTFDSLDGVEPAKTSQFLIDRIISKSDGELDGAIVLMHVGVRSTADALPAIIGNLQGRGFHLVTISKLLETAPKPQ
jgi:peptidoglycan/xylan/chitin deacetylase (PgdA/CDA1 family)